MKSKQKLGYHWKYCANKPLKSEEKNYGAIKLKTNLWCSSSLMLESKPSNGAIKNIMLVNPLKSNQKLGSHWKYCAIKPLKSREIMAPLN